MWDVAYGTCWKHMVHVYWGVIVRKHSCRIQCSNLRGEVTDIRSNWQSSLMEGRAAYCVGIGTLNFYRATVCWCTILIWEFCLSVRPSHSGIVSKWL